MAERRDWPLSHLSPPTHLLKERHGELLVRDAVARSADVLLGLVGDVEVDPHQDVLLQQHNRNLSENHNQRVSWKQATRRWRARDPHEALGGVVHDAQLEALLVLEGLGQGTAEGV